MPENIDLAALRRDAATAPESAASQGVPMPPRFDWRTFWPLVVAGVSSMALAAVYVVPLLEPAHEISLAPLVAREDFATAVSTSAIQASGWAEPAPFAAQVAARVPGIVAELPIIEGTQLVAGETVVARLDTALIDAKLAPARAAVTAADAELARLDAEIARAKSLAERNLDARMKAAALAVELAALNAQAQSAKARQVGAREALAQNAEARLQLESRRADVAKLTAERDDIAKQITALESQIEFLATAADSYRKMAANAAGSALRAAQAESELAAAREKLVGLQARMSGISDALSAANLALKIAGELVTNPVALRKAAVEADAEVAGLAARIAAIDAHAKLAALEAGDALALRSQIDTLTAARAAQAANVAAARASLAALETEKALHTVISPVSGEVLAVLVRPGEPIGTHSTAICTAFEPTKIQIRVDLPLADVPAIRLGQPVEIAAEAVPARAYAGTVERFVRQADLNRNSLQVKIAVSDADARLKPDMLVRVRFMPVREAAINAESAGEENAPRVERYFAPRDAVVTREGQAYIFVYDPRGTDTGEGTARAVAVTVVENAPDAPADHVEITGPLSRSFRVIVAGVHAVADGSRVRSRD